MPDHHATHPLCDVRSDPVAERVRRRLAARRRALGLEARLLDAILGLRAGTIARLEGGQARIAPSHLHGLAEVLDVTVDWFFDGSGGEEPPAPPFTPAGPGPGEQGPEGPGALGPGARGADGRGPGAEGPDPHDRDGEHAGAAEARRFLAVYRTLRNPRTRGEIRELVRTLARGPAE